MYWIVYQLEETGYVEVARVQDGQVYGLKADMIKRLLVEGGWPERPAHWVLYGDYLFASNPIEGNALEAPVF